MITSEEFFRLDKEAWAYAQEVTTDEERAIEIANGIMDTISELEREDDRSGTNRLEELLEHHGVDWIAKEYGIV